MGDNSRCQKKTLVDCQLVPCGGRYKEVVEKENGEDVLYEVCERCGDRRFHPISFSSKAS